MKIWVCPECGGTRIAEWSRVYVRNVVTEWTDDGEPLDYGEDMVDWDSKEDCGATGYQCLQCEAEEIEPVLQEDFLKACDQCKGTGVGGTVFDHTDDHYNFRLLVCHACGGKGVQQ